jgi:phage terminase large subunit
MRVEIPYTKVFEMNRASDAKIIVNRGGSGASKSFSLGQMFMERFLSTGCTRILVLRKTFPAARLSTLALWRDLLCRCGVEGKVHENRQAWDFTYKSNLVHFGSVDDPEKIKSSWWNYIWVEEANEFTYEDYRILRLRLAAQTNGHRNQMFFSFNPISAFHWLKTDLVEKEADLEEIVSTYRDNPFLPDDYVRDIEALKDQDANFWAIYGLGEWGRLENLVYSNWDTVNGFPDFELDEFYGMDFGFNAPTVLVRIGRRENELWEEELVYQTRLTTTELISLMKERIPESKRDLPIYADPEDPKAIEEIYDAGFNIHSAENAVKPGIDTVKRFRVHMLKANEFGIKEKRAYSWMKDRNGIILDKPVKFFDHYQDAERYGVYTHLNVGHPGIFVVGRDSSQSVRVERRVPEGGLSGRPEIDPWFLGE